MCSSDLATPRARAPAETESAAAARLRPAPSRGILSTADVDADAGATATGAAEALASRMDPPSASIAPTTPATTPSRTIVASHAPRAPIAMDAPRRFARVLFLAGKGVACGGEENALSSSFQDRLSKSVSSRRAQKIERLKLIEKK